MGKYNVSIFNIAHSVGKIADLVDAQLTGHNKRVAYIAGIIARELNMTAKEQDEIVLAGLIHDVGALSRQERTDLLEFGGCNSKDHAERGYKLLSLFGPFKEVANHVRYHHTRWDEQENQTVGLGGSVLYVADRIDVLVESNKNILLQVQDISEKILDESGKMFNPQVVEGFMKVCQKEAFWLDSISGVMLTAQSEYYKSMEFTTDMMIQLGLFFSQIIDFRCRFTATHSSGIAAVASELARLKGYNHYDCTLMRFAGYVHDIGKLAVPIEIIEKPSQLTHEEYSLMKMHTYYTHQILSHIEGMDTVRKWAAYHHENIKGTGYPFGIKGKEMCEGCKIMKVADIFTALTEERPYRPSMDEEKVFEVFDEIDQEDEEFKSLVKLLKDNYEDLVATREVEQTDAICRYEIFIQ